MYHYEQNVGINMNIKSDFCESQMEMRNILLETGEKINPCYTVANNLAELFQYFGENRMFVMNWNTYLVKQISKQSIKDAAWVWLLLIVK